MQEFKVGDQVKVVDGCQNMHNSLREYMISGRKATVIRQSTPGKPNRYLVKFDVADASHGLYWLRGAMLGQAH